MQQAILKFLTVLFSFGFVTVTLALPADNLHLRKGGVGESPWGAGAFYHFAPVEGGLGIRADLGFQVSHYFGNELDSAFLVHAQSDSFLVAYSQAWGQLFSSPIRWTLGVDMNSPFSYFGESQIFFPLGDFEPFVTFRVQSTGFSVEGGDGTLFETGAAARFWLGSASLGAAYALHPDLRIASSFTYRATLGDSKLKDPGMFHLSIHWLWGATSAQ